MDVALVGLVLPDVENHSLAALKAAAVGAGLDATIVPFRGWPDLDRAARAILRGAPKVCGISIQSTEAALASVSLARTLRKRGYAGRLVCGGHFATLNAESLLEADAAVDVVVRFAGEDAVVALARGDDPSTVAGAVFRGLDGVVRRGPPAKVGGDVGSPIRVGDLPRHLGIPVADLLLSRGCEAHCAYCCVAGAADEARREAAKDGADAARAAYVRRDVSRIADEIAGLASERGARALHFMDDNVLPLDPDDALSWIRELGQALEARRAPRIAFSLQLRADVVTPALADALVDLGLVRAYVGVDGFSAPQLRALGRAAPASAGPFAMDALAARGVFPVCNALLLGPTIPFESVRAEIEGISAIRHGPVHLLTIDVRAGTTYHARAAARGLVEGGPLLPHWRFEDERTEILGEIVASLPTRLAERSVPVALYDLGWNLGLARRLVPQANVAHAIETYARVSAAWNADQVRLLRAAAEPAARRDRAAARELLARERAFVRAHDDALLAAVDRALVDVERAISAERGMRVRAHARGRLLSAVAFAMGLSGCGASSRREIGSRGDASIDASLDSGMDGGGADGGRDAAADAAPPPDAGGCGDRTVREGEYVGFPTCGLDCYDEASTVRLTFDETGVVVDIAMASGDEIPADVRECLEAALAAYCYPSLAGQTRDFLPHCWIA